MTTVFASGSKLRLLALVVLLAVAVWGTQSYWGAWLDGLSGAPEAAGDKAKKRAPGAGVPVLVAAADEQRDAVVIEAIGTARARRSVVLYPEAAGEVVEFTLTSGQRIEKGDVILRLDSRATGLSVKVAETRVREAESALQRSRKLRANNVRSAANVEDAEIIFERAKLELQQAQEALSDRILRAPFSGIVGIPKVETGDRITTSSEVISLDDRSTLLVEFEVAERYLSRLQVGMALSARTPAFADRPIVGTVDKIDSRVDPVSRTVQVRAAFPNDDDALRPGMSFFVGLSLTGPLYASVPELALQWRDGQSYVWRVVDGKAERVNVTARRRLNNRVLIEGDLSPGDIIVVEGVQRLRPGRAVEISAAQGS